jgi:hypothetical protein
VPRHIPRPAALASASSGSYSGRGNGSLPAPRAGKSGPSDDGKTVVVGAVEARPGNGRKRPIGRLRLQAIAEASAASLQGFIAAHKAKPL